MNGAARQSAVSQGNGQRNEFVRGERRGDIATAEEAPPAGVNGTAGQRARVYIAAENRLLREALSRMVMRRGDIDVVE